MKSSGIHAAGDRVELLLVLLDLQIVEALAFLLGELHVADVFLVQRVELRRWPRHRRGETGRDRVRLLLQRHDLLLELRGAIALGLRLALHLGELRDDLVVDRLVLGRRPLIHLAQEPQLGLQRLEVLVGRGDLVVARGGLVGRARGRDVALREREASRCAEWIHRRESASGRSAASVVEHALPLLRELQLLLERGDLRWMADCCACAIACAAACCVLPMSRSIAARRA
jgi:hypothetical protein